VVRPGLWVWLGVVGCTGAASDRCLMRGMVTTQPADGARDLDTDAVFEVFSDHGGLPELWVDGGGTDGWVPADVPVELSLSAGRTHTAVVRQCGQVVHRARIHARREPVGEALAEPTWAVDLLDPAAVWHSPPSRPTDGVLRSLVGEATLLLMTVDLSQQPALHVGFGEVVADVVHQHTCVSTDSIAVDVGADPKLAAGPEDLVLVEGDREYALRDLTLDAEVAASTTDLRGVRLAFDLDLRNLPGDPGTSVCPLISAYGVSCQPCADQDTHTADPACVPFELEWPEAPVVPGLVLDPNAPQDPAC